MKQISTGRAAVRASNRRGDRLDRVITRTLLMENLEPRRLLCVDHTGAPMMPPEPPADAIPVDITAFGGQEVTKTILIIRATWADTPTADPQSAASVLSMMQGVDAFMQQNSFGAVNFLTTVTDLIVLPGTQQAYIDAGIEAVLADARAAAAAANPAWTFTNYDLEAVRYNGGPGNFGGAAYVGFRGCWLKSSSTGVAAHEFGHNLGLYHANYWNPNAAETIVGPGANVEYGDVFDTMGAANAGAFHFNTYEKNRLGWLPNSNITTISSDATVRIFAHDLGVLDAQNKYAAKVKRGTERDYWLELRQNPGFASNPWLMNGIGVRWTAGSPVSATTQLLDTTPFTPDGRNDSAVVVGRTWTDPIYGINITALEKVAGSTPAMDVRVTFGKSPNAPVGSLSTSAMSVGVNQPVNFSVSASDADGDDLAYHWDFGDKSFGLNQSAAVKSWSSAGKYRVRVTVSDMRGNTWSDSVVLTVGAPPSNRYTVQGQVLDKRGDPVEGVLVHNGLAPTATNYRFGYTDSDGKYTLTNLVGSSYAITALRPAAAQTTVGFANPLTVSSDRTGIDFASTAQQFKITGRVTDAGGAGVPGALVTNGQITEPTDLNGFYTLPNAELGSYTVTAQKNGYDLYRSPLQPAIVNFADATNITVREVGFALTGQITGVPAGTFVDLSTGTATLSYLAQGGTLNFTMNVPAGRAYLRATSSGASFTPNFSIPMDVSGNLNGLLLAYGPQNGYGIAGRVSELGEGVEGAVISISPGGHTLVTDPRGNYFIDGLEPGAYSVSVVKDGISFVQPVKQVNITNAHVFDENFVSSKVNAAPTFVTPAFANPNPTRNFTTAIGALGADDQGEATLRYDWSVVSAPAGATVAFDLDNYNSAKDTLATFSHVGLYTLRVTLIDLFGATTSSDVVVNIDRTPPTLTGAATFAFETAQAVHLPFSENVGPSLSGANFSLLNLTTGQPVPASVFDVTFNAATHVATVAFVGNALGDADYRLTFDPTGVTDLAGNPLAAGTILDFFVLAGDANRDRSVGIADFAILASHFNAPGTFGQGDFNYNGQVEIGDFAILAARFNNGLASSRAVSAATLPRANPVESPFGQSRIGELRELLDGVPV